ncbi:acyl-CoA dehydrogenase family protein [Nocardioides kribbensis]|uniref:acyl-CoA dehydrogenase family protein n=1 Tax=Nocardioides kribbensis TaxID=305517 RepID=UPI00187B0EB4|nr:acyl-CoA dehydrogenase family protein [Nocardioides kribbensis]
MSTPPPTSGTATSGTTTSGTATEHAAEAAARPDGDLSGDPSTTGLEGVELTDSPFSDFLGFELLLEDDDRELLGRVRAFMNREVEPVINEHWTRGEFPHELVQGIADLGIAGLAYDAPGCPARGALVDGLVAMELSRVDPSIGTFMGVHGGLAMGSIALCGSPEQQQRWLPAMARLELIGAFGLTEPETGSAISQGLSTTARRDGDAWVLNGEKKWIGNASFADLVVVWARDEDDGQVKGFVVEKDTEGMTFDVQRDKIALRVVQNAEIHLRDVRVPEENRLQEAHSFHDTSQVLRVTRMGVAWQAAGCARGAYEHALRYTKAREQFGRPIASFQMVQDLLVKMLSNVTASTAMNVRASQLQVAGLLRDEHASLCKVHSTVRMRETVGWAREVLGGNGILLEHHVGRFVADAEAIYSYEGTREINTLIVGRAITGESAFV